MPWRSRLAWAWTLIIFALCWIPREYLGEHERIPGPLIVLNFDKVIHLGIFAVFSVLWMRVGTSRSRGWWIFFVGIAIGVITELGQRSPIVNRDGSLGDGLADSLGVIVGLFGYWVGVKVLEKRAVPAG